MNEKIENELKLIRDYTELIHDKLNYLLITQPAMDTDIKAKLDYLSMNNKLNKIILGEVFKRK